MTSTATALEISCAKPDCAWKGPPSEAPGHLCPTPSPILAKNERQPGHPFAGIIDADGKPIADDTADRTLPVWVVWSHDGETRILGTRPTLEEGAALAQSVQVTVGEVMVQEHRAFLDEAPPPPAADAPPDAPAAPVAYDSDPATRDDLEAWLLAHGSYDDQGVPQDEKTATLDARLSVLLEHAQADEGPDLDSEPVEGEVVAEEEPPPATPAPGPVEPEPELEPQPIAAEAAGAGTGEEMTGVEVPLGEYVTVDVTGAGAVTIEGADPWELPVAAAIKAGPTNYRWAVVDKTRAKLLGRAKTKKEAEDILRDAPAGVVPDVDAAVIRADDVLQAAAEIEKRRELVDDPDTSVPASPDVGKPEEEPAPSDNDPGDEDDAKKALAAAQAAQATAPGGGALFDPSDYETGELALAKVDGQSIDRIKVAFSGSVMLDRSAPADVALYRKLKLGEEVELRVAGRVSGTGAKGATNREGDLDVVVGEKTIAVTTVYRLAAEELS